MSKLSRKNIAESEIVPSDRLLMLIGFIGQELLLATRRKAITTGKKQSIEITDRIVGGKFTLRVAFEGEGSH